LTEQSREAITGGRRVAEVVAIDLGPVFADARADEFEERLKFVLREVDASAGRIVLLLSLGPLDEIDQLCTRHETVRAELDQAVRDADWEKAARRAYESSRIEQEIAAARCMRAAPGSEDDSLLD
jgi:hypothetical protein